MGSKKDRWNEDNLRNLINRSLSKSEVLRKMGFKGTEGGHHTTLNKYLKFYNIDVSHFTGKAWNCGERAKTIRRSPPIPLEDLLIENSLACLHHIKKRILRAGLMKYECVECGATEWRGKKISLHMDHINGNSSDHRLENLRLLCPNCHSQTITYCRRKSIQPKQNLSGKCNNALCGNPSDRKYCSIKCYHESRQGKKGSERLCQRKIERPTKDVLAQKIKNQSFCSLGREYGVSDNAIRKWCRYYEIEIPRKRPRRDSNARPAA